MDVCAAGTEHSTSNLRRVCAAHREWGIGQALCPTLSLPSGAMETLTEYNTTCEKQPGTRQTN